MSPNPQFHSDLITFTEEILDGKFVQKSLGVTIQILWLFIVSLLKNANIIKKSLDKPCIYPLVDYIRCYYGSNF